MARKVASKLGSVYVDSGSLYRAVAWKAQNEGIDAGDAPAIDALVAGIQMRFNIEAGVMASSDRER